MGMVLPPQMNGQPNGMAPAPAMAPQQPVHPPAPQLPPQPAQPDPRAWAKSWKRPEEWTDDFLITKFNTWDGLDNPHWKDWKDEARVNYDMVAGRQLPEEAKAENEEKGLVAITINKIDATVSAVSGSEMSNQLEAKYFPREMSTRGPDGRLQDVAVNEIFTGAADWIREESDAADEESEGFRDTLICGLGVTEGRMDYDTDPDGMAVIERCDPLEFRIDSAARRPNAVDARRVTREKPFPKDEAKDRFGVEEGGKQPSWERGQHDNNPGDAYKSGQASEVNKDDIWIIEYQWWALERVYRVANPLTGQLEDLTEDEFKRIIVVMPNLEQDSASIKVRRYYRAFRCGDQILEVTPLPDEEFTYKFITGKLDRNKGVWYGLVRAMVDPQRLLNKQISQTQRIVDTNAKGGLLAEADSFEDQQQAENDWAASDTIVWTKPGKLQSGAVIPKPIAPTPSGIDKLLAIADGAIPATSGVNAEMMGAVDRQQAGVVDVQRKEAAYGVLQAFFRSMKRYKRLRGKHLLKLISRYMSDGRLIRLTGRNGNVQYLPLVRQPDTLRYDVIVDDAPTGPNQRDKVMQWLLMFGGPLLAKMNLPPQVLFKFLEFSPLPSALISEVQQMLAQMPKGPDPEAIKAQGEAAKLQADMQKMQMDMQANQMRAQLDAAKLQGENQKLAVENEWVKIEMAKTAMDHRSSEQEAMLRARETQMREKNDAEKIAADIRKSEVDAQIKLAELQIKQQELELAKAELALKARDLDLRAQMDVQKMAMAEQERTTPKPTPEPQEPRADKTSDALGLGLQALAQALNKPKSIVRGPDGRAIGVE